MSMHAHSEIAREATTVAVLAEEVEAVKARRTSALAELDYRTHAGRSMRSTKTLICD